MFPTSFRLLAMVCLISASSALAAEPAAITPEQRDAPETRLAMAQQVRARYARADARLRIANLKPAAEQVPLHERFELQFTLEGRFDSPFDPDQVKVDGLITRPDGSTITVPAFFMEPYKSFDGQAYLQANVRYTPAGEAGWRLRYAPTQAGAHSIVLRAEQASPRQTITTDAVRFTAAPSDHAGYVRISQRNPQYFEYTNGALFYPAAANIPWTRTNQGPHMGRPDGSYEYYFGKARGHMQATRVWACHYAWLEWMPLPGQKPQSSWNGYGGLNHYNQMIAGTFDRVFQLAEDADLRIMLVLDDNDEQRPTPAGKWFWGNWLANPYNTINGGPCTTPEDFFTHVEARRAYRNRIRYVMARWGYSPSLWAINVWNDRPAPPRGSLPWLREMRDFAHELADGWRPMIFGTNFAFEAQAISDYAQAQEAGVLPGKPNVKQEAYYTRTGEFFLDTVRFELWKHLSRGYGGVMLWPHPQIDQHDAWPAFAAVTRFLEGLPLNERPFAPVDARVVAASIENPTEPATRVLAMQDYGDIPNWGARSTEDRFEIDLNGGNQFLPGMARKLYSNRKNMAAWRTEPTFIFSLPAPGSFVVEVRELSGENRLSVSDNGQPLMDIEIEGSGRRALTGEARYLRVPLAAGSHALKIALNGDNAEWLDMRRLLLVYQEPDPARLLTVYGLASDRHALLYLRNGTVGELEQTFLRQAPRKITGVDLEIAGLAAGRYDRVIYDVDAGRELQREAIDHTGGPLPVHIDRIDAHIAVKVIPTEGN